MTTRKPRPHLTRRQAAVRLVRAHAYAQLGWTHLEIANALGCDRSTVTYYLGPRCKAGAIR